MKKYGFTLYAIGYIIIIVAVIGFIFNPISYLFDYIPYIFSAGATLSIVGRVLTLPQSDDFRVRRLNNMLAVSAILIIGSAVALFIAPRQAAATTVMMVRTITILAKEDSNFFIFYLLSLLRQSV